MNYLNLMGSIFFNIFQTLLFLISQSHYTCDIITGLFAGIAIVATFEVIELRRELTLLKKKNK